MAYQIKKWLSRDSMILPNKGEYRITSSNKPFFIYGYWREPNAGGYQIILDEIDVRLLLGEEFMLEPCDIMELAISKYDFHAALAQKMTKLDTQILSLRTMLSETLTMIADMVKKPEIFATPLFGNRLQRLKTLFTKMLVSDHTPKEMDTLYPEIVKELNEKNENPYEIQESDNENERT